ncbi:MAG: tRNA (adenosine(37)-N6)-threonylcarbamoyltransferase complex dimerization subunit type 1 TsaB [bacterium]
MALYFIGIQGSYSQLELALFEEQRCIQTFASQDTKASSHIIPYLDTLLKNHSRTLSDLSFIAVDKGPGAFTSLRVVIATVNGIAFARKIPLIGIDGLDALYEQTKTKIDSFGFKQKPDVIACLLNAYNDDVYFLIKSSDKTIKACKKVDVFLEELSSNFSGKDILFTGNAVQLHIQKIQEVFGAHALIPASVDLVASAVQIGTMGYREWQQNKDYAFEITPNYIKTQYFAIKK